VCWIPVQFLAWPIQVFKGITNPGNEDLKYYYPTVLVTGQDIIFFWVARMVMAGMHLKSPPVRTRLLTGMVRDKLEENEQSWVIARPAGVD
jgi:valyl-tRNA synthetase